ncbi:peptide deformylase [Butyrivibrio sp. NC2002]|uniref:peptide deformylase n=1 Tax=Butyrivibrio sp. NC2002 TaxID=1410610 RepID=UPI000A4D4F04|nr:peptide deformylase [Butyrivibrio sp. NC2002]
MIRIKTTLDPAVVGVIEYGTADRRDYYRVKVRGKHGKYNGFTAQIIQHEIDHFSGVLI